MQTTIWIIIIILALLLIRLLRKWIKRLIFIAILLTLAFFIYGIFSPSGAGKLWYNISTFPQRITSWISDTNFLNYEDYKLNISKYSDNTQNSENTNEDNEIEDEDNITNEENITKESDNLEIDENKESDNTQNMKSFPKFEKLTNILDKHTTNNRDNNTITGYSKSDILGVINGYIEGNLDDNTDILVTVEYEDNYNDPQKIILQTQTKTDEPTPHPSANNQGNLEQTTYQVKKSNNGLSQKEIEETEEVFSILF